MLPGHIKEALDSILGELDSEEADTKRKKYAPPEPEAAGKPHGVSITIIAGGKHPEPDGDEKVGEGVAEPLESPDELAKLLGDGEDEGEEEDGEEEKAPPVKPKKKLRRY